MEKITLPEGFKEAIKRHSATAICVKTPEAYRMIFDLENPEGSIGIEVSFDGSLQSLIKNLEEDWPYELNLIGSITCFYEECLLKDQLLATSLVLSGEERGER